MPKKKALITGVTGMVGSHLADFLIKHTKWDVHGVCRWRSPLENVEQRYLLQTGKRVFFTMPTLDYVSLLK